MLAAIAVKARICRVGKIACHAVDRLLGARAIPGRSRGQVLPTRIAPGAHAWARRAKLGDAGVCEGRAFATLPNPNRLHALFASGKYAAIANLNGEARCGASKMYRPGRRRGLLR